MIWSTNQSPAPQFRKYLGTFNSFIILRTPHHVRHPTKARNSLQDSHPHSNHLKYPKDSSPILPHPTSIPPNKSIHPLQHVELPPRKRPISSCQRFGASDKIVWDEIRFLSCLPLINGFFGGCVLKFCFGTKK